MDHQERSIRFGAALLIAALLLRLVDAGSLELLRSEKAASFLVYLQTGRVVRLSQPEPAAEQTAPPQEEPEPPTPPEFSAGDLSLIDIRYNCDKEPDLEELLTRPLDYNLSGEGPTVLILHSHATESYTPEQGADYEPSGDYRTLDPGCNMLRIGAQVAQRLEEAGISVIHDTTLHDQPSYNDAYHQSAASARAYLEEYPSIRLVLDLHRDAADLDYGQMVTHCLIDGAEAAQLMFVVGSDAGGLHHPDWEENLSLALKLQVLLEREDPGICRQSSLTYQRFNQHLAPGALLVEVGAAGNTLAQALPAADALAEAIIKLFPM